MKNLGRILTLLFVSLVTHVTTLKAQTMTSFVSGLNGPSGIAFDGGGNLYVSNYSGNTVNKVTAGGVVSTFATGMNGPTGIAFDAGGNLYVSNYFSGNIIKVTSGGISSTFATGLSNPVGLAFDVSGNLFVANSSSSSVSKITSGGTISTFATGFNLPYGIAFDASGNLFVANLGGSNISKVTSGGVVSTFATGLSLPSGIIADGTGALYVVEKAQKRISKVSKGGVVSLFISSSLLNNSQLLTLDASGKYLYVANLSDNTVSKITIPAPPPAIWYVKPTASGTGDGSSWANAASDLQAIINGASKLDTIWVAKGTYNPTRDISGNNNPGDQKTKTFLLRDSVMLYGGFSGTETSLSQRNIAANPSILSGDFNGDDGANFTNYTENAYHVAVALKLSAATVFDGFTITDGDASNGATYSYTGFPVYYNDAGGLYNVYCNYTIKNLTFTNNRCTGEGGGAMFNASDDFNASTVTVNNCTFTNNASTATYGGAVYTQKVTAYFNNCVFTGNAGFYIGGATYQFYGSSYYNNCIFYNNSSLYGGAIGHRKGSLTLKNTVIANNTSVYYGGAIYGVVENSETSGTITNCTIYGNTTTGTTASSNGYAMSGEQFNVSNSIFWSNTGSNGTGIEINGLANGIDVNNSVVVKGNSTYSNSQNNNVSSDPRFVNTSNLIGNDGIWGTADDGLMLSCGSSAFKLANNTPTATDIVGIARPQFTTADAGAYEATTNLSAPPPVGNASQTFLNSGTVADLKITSGTNINWYAASSGGSPLASTTALVDGNHYYASQTAAGTCGESGRLDVKVSIIIYTPVTITSFTPSSGIIGSTVTLTGTNFNTTAANNIVRFGGVLATVTAASATSLTVTVPVGATYDAISVLNTDLKFQVYSSAKFSPTIPVPKATLSAKDFEAIKDLGSNGQQTYSTQLADLDGDGKLDVVDALQNGYVAVRRNTSTVGNISLANYQYLSGTSSGYIIIKTADIDGDGKLDIIGVSNADNNVHVYINTSTPGNISFSPQKTFYLQTTSGAFGHLEIGDLDNDGKLDMVVVEGWGLSAYIFRNTTTAPGVANVSFDTPVSVPGITTGQTVNSTLISDVDGDGKMDLIISYCTYAAAPVVDVLKNKSTPGSFIFDAPISLPHGSSSVQCARALKSADINGDGLLDILVINNQDNSLHYFINTTSSGNISFAAYKSIKTIDNAQSFDMGDINGDGKIDMVIQNATNYSSIHGNDQMLMANSTTGGTVSFVEQDIQENKDANNGSIIPYWRVNIGDLDGDGKMDLYVASSKYPTSNSYAFRYNPKIEQPGNALNFDGSSTNVNLGNNLKFISTGAVPGQFTLELWLKMDAYNGAYSRIFGDEINGNHGSFLEIDPNGFVGAFSPGTGRVASTCKVPLNKWTHLALIQDATNLSLYANGVFQGVLLSGADLYQETTDTKFIGVFGGGGRNLNGSIDELRIWNIARTPAQLKANFLDTVNASTSGLVAYYRFDQGTANGNNAGVTTLQDITGNGNNGTLNNFALNGTSSNWVESYAMVVPTATAATSVSTSGFTANWTVPVEGTVDNGYNVYVATDSLFTAQITGSPFTVASTATSSALNNLTPATYYYRVTADKTSVTGQGGFSNTISVVLKPVISTTGSLSALSTTYGTASSNTTLNVSGTGMKSAITVAVPAGFEVSTNVSSGFSSSITVGAAGTIAATAIYIRLAATDLAGNYSGNLVLSSTSADTVKIAIPGSAVNKAPLTITAKNQAKCFGQSFSFVGTEFTSVGLKSLDSVNSISLSSAATVLTATVAGSPYSITPSAAVGKGLANYNISYVNGSFTVNALPNASVSATAGTIICGAGGSIILTGSGGDTYAWTLGGLPITGSTTGANLTVTNVGVYTAIVTTTATGCSAPATNSITVTQLLKPTVSFTSTNYCVNVPVVLTNQSTVTNSGPINYQWSDNIGNSATSSNASFTYASYGSVTIKLKVVPQACPTIADSVSKVLSILAPTPATRYAPVDVIYNNPTQLQARSLGTTYLWTPSTGLSDPTVYNPTVRATAQQDYKIIMSAPSGCTTTDSVLVRIFENNIYVPNVFSPNGDGQNDVLYVNLVNIKQLKSFRIYDRWGKKLFETSTMGQGWDGKSNGVLQHIDTYVWVVEAIDNSDRPLTKTGNITLIR